MISEVEPGGRAPTVLVLDRIATALGTSIARLTRDESLLGPLLLRRSEQDVLVDPGGWERRILSPVLAGVEFEFMPTVLGPGVDAGVFLPHVRGSREHVAIERKQHTNYRHHRVAAEMALGVEGDREALSAAVSRWAAAELEAAIGAAGECSAAMHDRPTWRASAPGAAAAQQPLAATVDRPRSSQPDLTHLPPGSLPFAGVRVLDLTGVLAGPVCTRFLAAYGADVLRIDPRGFSEVSALVPATSSGKHCAALDLKTKAIERPSSRSSVPRTCS